MSTVKEIGKQIKAARLAAGETQDSLAIKVGVSRPRIAELENGKGNPTLETLTAVCKALRKKLRISIE